MSKPKVLTLNDKHHLALALQTLQKIVDDDGWGDYSDNIHENAMDAIYNINQICSINKAIHETIDRNTKKAKS